MQNNAALYEKTKGQEGLKTGSESVFGFLMVIIFLIIGQFPLWDGDDVVVCSLATASLLTFTVFVFPRLLHSLNTAWCRLGQILHLIMTPLIMGIIFFLVFIPMAIMFKLVGRNLILRKFVSHASTFWIEYNSRAPASIQD